MVKFFILLLLYFTPFILFIFFNVEFSIVEFLFGILMGGLGLWLYNYIFRKNHNPIFQFSTSIFQSFLSFEGIESFRKSILRHFSQLKSCQLFVFNNESITLYPKDSRVISRRESKLLEYYMQKALYEPFKVDQFHSFMLYSPVSMCCYAYGYTVPFFNTRVLILMYTETHPSYELQEKCKSINDLFLVAMLIENFSKGQDGIFGVLRETVWNSPYAVGFTDPSGKLEIGNDELYQLFQGDIPNFVDLIGKDIFMMLLDGKRIGQNFMLQGRRIQVEAFPIANKNFLVTKCFFIFVDNRLESKRELLDEVNTLKRFTSGSSIVGAAMFTQEGLILYSNEAFMSSLDIYKVREATQKSIFELFDLTEEFFKQIVEQILLGEEKYLILQGKDKEEEYSVLFKGVVFGDKTIIELVLQDNTIYHDNLSYLDKETETLYEELKTARSIQEHILTLPTIYRPGVYVNTLYKPAYQLSGDFFTIIPIDDDKMGVLMADVSGHGISASLITAALKTLIEFVPNEAESLPKIMSYFNTYLAGILPEGSFVTLFYGIIDHKESTLQYINSGHPFPLLEDIDKNEVKILEGMGYPLGGLLNVSFDDLVYTIQLPRRSRLILYTDGLLQHLSGTIKDKLGEIRHLIEKHRNVNDKVMLEIFFDNLLSKVSTLPDDDVSMMIISIDETHTYKHRLSISSSLLEVDTVIEQIGAYIKKSANLTDSQYWKLHTCFYESLLNAVVHGNKYNMQKKVYIEFRIFLSLVVLRIRDEGPGFDYNNLPDPFAEENILKDFGRGIQMVRMLATRVKFNHEGNETTIFLDFSDNKKEKPKD